MLSNTRVLALIGGCIIVLLILTSCQPGNSTSETPEETVIVSEEIIETVVVAKTVGDAQPAVEQQTIMQTPVEQEHPTATLPIVEPKVCPPTATLPIVEPTVSPPTATLTNVEPTASSPIEESVRKILLIDRMADWDSLTYTSLIEIAASKGVEVDIFDDNQFIVDDKYDGIIVFGGGGGNNETSTGSYNFHDLMFFTTGGKRLVVFALPRLANNTFIGDPWTFGITVKSEYLTPPGKDVISVPGGVLSEMWSGLEIGSKTAYDEVSLQTYFESNYGSYTSISNLDCVQRKTSIMAGFTSGEYLFISNFVTGDGDIQYRNNGNFLHDGNIDGWDNQRAAEILIDWLVGNQSS